jgi:hypothetical protein
MEITKSTKYPTPFWQHQDAAHENQQRAELLMNRHGELGGYIGSKGSPTQKPRRAYLNAALQVVEDGASGDDDDDKDKDRDSPMDVDKSPSPPPPPARRFVGVKTRAPRA